MLFLGLILLVSGVVISCSAFEMQIPTDTLKDAMQIAEHLNRREMMLIAGATLFVCGILVVLGDQLIDSIKHKSVTPNTKASEGGAEE